MTERQPTTESLQREINDLRRQIQDIKRVIDKQNDPGGVGKRSLFDD
jgi:hypothetical protein